MKQLTTKLEARIVMLFFASLATAVALSLPGAGPASTTVLPQIGQSPGHVHEGELGEIYLAVERDLKCNCGCNLDVHTCQFTMQCGTSPVWSQRILAELEAGETPEAIKAGFVADFGPTVLMAPPAEGFNLVGYLLPATAILTVGMLVGLMVRRNSNRDEDFVPMRSISSEEQARLEAEMQEMERAEDLDW